MAKEKMIQCERCSGTASVLYDKLLPFEVEQYSSTEVAEAFQASSRYSPKYIRCPVCPRYGSFGLVPPANAIEGALRGSGRDEGELAEQKVQDAWLKEFFKGCKRW
jgi:hypothetical protein